LVAKQITPRGTIKAGDHIDAVITNPATFFVTVPP